MVSFKNHHKEEIFTPSTMIFVDKSISLWYGICREWIGDELTMYVEIYFNPYSGCDIQDAVNGKLGIIIWLILVNTEV